METGLIPVLVGRIRGGFMPIDRLIDETYAAKIVVARTPLPAGDDAR